MSMIISEIAQIMQIPVADFRKGKDNNVYATAPKERVFSVSAELSNNFELVSLFCVENFGSAAGFTLFYIFERSGDSEFLIIQQPLEGKRAKSVAGDFPSACWYEREIMDGYGIDFLNAADKRRLLLHEPYPADFHPLLKSFRNQPIKTLAIIKPEDQYKHITIEGEGVYQIPVGPVHAGIIEPGHFRFSVIGETIFNLEIRMFYKHRGVEKLAEGKQPQDCLQIAESISGDESAANSAAFCHAVEKICGAGIPTRALQLRTLFLEMERIYSHLGDMAGMIVDVAFPAGAADFFILREEILRQNHLLTGSRFLKNIIKIGGIKKDCSDTAIAGLSAFMRSFIPRLNKAVSNALSSVWVIDRLENTGIIKKDLVKPLHLTGPTARAAGIPGDTRADHSYGIYNQIALPKLVKEKGDVLSRFELKAAEIQDSVRIIRWLLSELKPGDTETQVKIADGFALSVIEAPRGQTMQWVYIRNGVIDRYKVRTASFCNWRAIEHAVIDNIVPDFPLINKSMNLSYAGTDL